MLTKVILVQMASYIFLEKFWLESGASLNLRMHSGTCEHKGDFQSAHLMSITSLSMGRVVLCFGLLISKDSFNVCKK